MQKIDANIILRYLLNDHEEQSAQAKKIIEEFRVEIPVEVLCEVVFVLTGYYKIDRQNICINLKSFFEETKCTLPNRQAVLRGIEYFTESTLDFVDCILAGYAAAEKHEIITFDAKLQNFISKIK